MEKRNRRAQTYNWAGVKQSEPLKHMYSMHMLFEFDQNKAAANWHKHRVRFEDVEPVFDDPYALTRPDPDAKDEPRWLTVGSDALRRVVTVCYPLA